MLLTILYITFKTYIRVFFGDKKNKKNPNTIHFLK